MNCFNARKSLPRLAAGEITGVMEQKLNKHLTECQGCRSEFQEMKKALELLKDVPRTAPPPAFSSIWRQRVRQEALKKEASRFKPVFCFKHNFLIPSVGVVVVMLVCAITFKAVRLIPHQELAGRGDLKTNQLEEKITALPETMSLATADRSEGTFQVKILDLGPQAEAARELIAAYQSDPGVEARMSSKRFKFEPEMISGLSQTELAELTAKLKRLGAKVEILPNN